MRVSASLGLVVLLASLATCEQRNFDRCQVTGTDFQCESGKFCKADAEPSGYGTCVASECTVTQVPSGCGADKPICSAQGHCVACDPASKGQCAAINPKLPACVAPTAGSTDYICAECSTTADCTVDASRPAADVSRPACDTATHTCRGCALHSECPAPQVCVKDDTLSTLKAPNTLLRGMCAAPSQVIIVDNTTCPMSCTLQSQVLLASATKPFVLVRNNYTGGIVQFSPINGLPEQHLIGGNADTPPAGLAMGTLPSAVIATYNTTTPTVTVAAGAHVTIEGFVLRDNYTALSCNSGGTMATSITLLRSIIMNSTLAIQTTALCKLTLDQSWIGAPPNNTSQIGNDEAMQLDSTQFDIINSVFDHNFKPSTFGGITLTDSQPGNLVGHIINSTFYRHEALDATPALAIYCKAAPKTLTLFNTLFVNAPGVTSMRMKPFVSPVCGTATNFSFGYVATDESPAPAGMGVVTGVTDSLFTTPASSVLSLVPSAPSGVLTGGVLSFAGITSPTVDALGNPRSKSKISIGAYEQVPPAP